ncbi:DNA polymerase delta small subunit Cdc1 [Stygiomarasmius scandens]|uniref:DNA polymerase delta small subunit Cdc1 n=1 Tax=Marasmiellus scandens TaxID=2682957 RepID=A0ABR1JLF4_9AGAR
MSPRESDPAGTVLPQQPFPKGMFRAVGAYHSLSRETNPVWLKVKEGKEKRETKEPNPFRAAIND